MPNFKKAVPESRTIVPGNWSDLLDDASVVFDASGNVTEVRVNLKNLTELGALFAAAMTQLHAQNDTIITELKLTNMHLAEIGETGLTLDDVEQQGE